MKHCLSILLSMMVCTLCGAQMKTHIETLSSSAMEGRLAGSEGESEAASYIAECLAAYGLDLLYGKEGDTFGMKMESGDTLRSRNVAAVLSGYDNRLKDKYIVVGARLDNLGTKTLKVDGNREETIAFGANGNASGLALMLELARNLALNRALLKRSVIFVAFGASLQSNAGSWYFLNRSFPHVEDIDAMINLDMLGTGDSNGFYAYTASNPDMNNIIDAMVQTLQPVYPKVVAPEPVASDHRSFYASRIPSVFFTTGMYPEYRTNRDTPSIIEYDAMERELEYIFNFTVSLSGARKPDFEASAKQVTETSPDIVPYSECDVKPSFLNSQNPDTFMKKWVYVYLKYPKEAVDNGIQGRVLVDFIIDEKGKVGSVKVLKGVHPLLDAEAVKVVSASPDWKPARLRGKKVRTELSVYIYFKLKKRK